MQEAHEFLEPQCTIAKMDRFLSRQGILRALQRELPKFGGTLLDVGCGQKPYKSILTSHPSRVTRYIGLDLKDGMYASMFGAPDLEWDGKAIPLPNASVDCAIATEVLEQCLYPEVLIAEVARVLTPGGIFFFTVPFFWPIHDPPHDQYRFTHFALERYLKNCGLSQIELHAFGGWDASLAQMIALWVRRRPMDPMWRRVLSVLLVPIVRTLARIDRVPNLEAYFEGTVMITAISGTALKLES